MRTMKGAMLSVAVGLGLALASSAASANIVFLPGNNPQPGEENILFDTGDNGPGSSVSGSTGSGAIVTFGTTTGQTIFTNSHGQAKIETNDNEGFLTSMMVSVTGHTFTDFIVNLSSLQSAATITVNASDGTFTDVLAPGPGNGSNFITIIAQGAETISSISFTSTSGFGQFQQPRISGLATPIPEPSTWAMMLIGFAGLGYAAARRIGKDRLALPLGSTSFFAVKEG